MCSHDPFFGTNRNRILKNGSCERAFKKLVNFSAVITSAVNYLEFKDSAIFL